MAIREKVFNGKSFLGKINGFVDVSEASSMTTGSSISSRRNFSRSPVLERFRSMESYGSYTKGPEVKDVFKRIWNNPKGSVKDLYNIWRNEFKLYGKEKKFLFSDEVKVLEKGDIDMLFTFDHEKCFDRWMLMTDKTSMNGFSTASLVRTNSDTALFSGNIDTTVPKDGKTQYSGFASIITKRLLKSFQRFDTYDWSHYTHLVLKVRGDGRNYMIILGCPGEFDVTYQDQFQFPLYTRGGPYWQIVKIPLSEFFFVSKARMQDRQCMMPYDACSRVGITVGDGINGPFSLEIDYFGLEYQAFHKAISPYEAYYVGRYVAE